MYYSHTLLSVSYCAADPPRAISHSKALKNSVPDTPMNLSTRKESIDTTLMELRSPQLAVGMIQQGQQQPTQKPPLQPSVSFPSCIDYSLKVEPSKPVRRYQSELARPGINGENYIFCAPTGTGKTLVAGLIISDHLQKRQNLEKKVIFVVPTRPLAEQQCRELQNLIPGAKVISSIGDETGMTIKDVLKHNDIIVCTAGKLLNELKGSLVAFSDLGLMVLDECHHACKNDPHARMMEKYLEKKRNGTHNLPQIVGLTASPGAGENPTLEMDKTIDHLISLCALMDATSGIQTVRENVVELDEFTNKPTFTLKILKRRKPMEEFIQHITDEITRLEKQVDLTSPFHKWSQEYKTSVQQKKLPLELSPNPDIRDHIRILDLLLCYSRALNIYMDLQDKDAIRILSDFMINGLPDDEKANRCERQLKQRLRKLIDHLRQLRPVPNPLLQQAEDILHTQFARSPHSKGILFVHTKKHASSMCDWISALPIATSLHIRPRTITGHTRETGYGMTQDEQEEVMECFRRGECNLLVATSVAEEGLDIPACNLVIRFQHVTNEIGRTLTQGRARTVDSECFTILSSDSRKAYQEIKNDELQSQVDEVLEKYFPTGPSLREQLSERQQQIIRQHQLKRSLKEQQQKTKTREDVQLKCKKCKEFACYGSDIYTVTENATYYVVPDADFKEYKVVKKPHHSPKQISQAMNKTHKIHCATCGADWGIMCVWPIEGHEFPVLKCKSFIFEISGVLHSIRKWSDMPFEVLPLSDRAHHSVIDSESD